MATINDDLDATPMGATAENVGRANSEEEDQDTRVKVMVRVRPVSSDEAMKGSKNITDVQTDKKLLTVESPGGKITGDIVAKQFTFDDVFDEKSQQKQVYASCASSCVDSVLNGYNATIFAYGQTGSGKTFTMDGLLDSEELQGIIPNTFKHIFNHIARSDVDVEFLVRVSYLEIYNDDIFDLLAPVSKDKHDANAKLDLRESIESGVHVQNLSFMTAKSEADMNRIMRQGKTKKTTGFTLMNDESSRSHSIFTIVVEGARGGHVRVGKLNLVDLAGSERQSKVRK